MYEKNYWQNIYKTHLHSDGRQYDPATDSGSFCPPIKEHKAYKTETVTVSPRADQIEWVYKVVDEVLYRRKYNFTRGEWVGDWQRLD